MIAKTPRLTIRQLQLSDAAFVLTLYNDPSFLQHIGDKGVRTLADAEKNLQQGAIASYAEHGYGMWLVEDWQGQAIGLCGLIKRDFLTETDLPVLLFSSSLLRLFWRTTILQKPMSPT